MLRPSVLEPLLPSLIKHDSILFAVMLSLLALSKSLYGRPWKRLDPIRQAGLRILRLLSLSILILYILDVLSLYFFSTRLYFTDIALMKYETPGGRSLLATLWTVILKRPLLLITPCLGSILGWLLSLAIAVFFPAVPGPRKRRWQAGLAAALALLYFIPLPMYMSSFIYKPLTENLFERNRELLFPMRYSPEFKSNLLRDFHDEPACATGAGKRMNIIVLMVESFSAYHSRFFSGLDDFTPNLDRLAAKYTSIPDFYANGWTTQGGLISLFTSSFPIVPERAEFNELSSIRLKDFLSPDESMAECFNRLGYTTSFYCAGDLTFMGQDKWLRTIGFQDISGDDAPEYAGQARGAFKSVPDRALYDKALAYTRSWGDSSRHLLVLETLWSHRPYHSPIRGQPDNEENVFRYVDSQIGYLYDGLEASGFFKNGILLITGDHRTMHPYKKEEIARYGLSVTARIPMVIVEESLGLPKTIPGSFSQKDVLPSLEALVSDRPCRSRFVGSFLSHPPQPPPCIIHARGDERDRVYVKCGTEEAVVELKGDDARFVSGGLRDGKDVIQKMHYERIRK